jgi:hypothetical protein
MAWVQPSTKYCLCPKQLPRVRDAIVKKTDGASALGDLVN